MALLLTFLLGFFILAGALIGKLSNKHQAVEQISIAVAFGTMLAMAALDLLPEAQEHLEELDDATLVIVVCVVVGIFALKLLDRFIPHHDSHDLMSEHDCTNENVAHIGIITTVAVTLHNFIEGMALFSVATESMLGGLLMALGIGLHNIPMGMVIYSTLKHESSKRAIGLLSAAALSTFVGGLVMMGLWFAIDDVMVGVLISLTLGMICYIVFFELLPHLAHSKNRLVSVLGVIVGILIVVVGISLGGE